MLRHHHPHRLVALCVTLLILCVGAVRAQDTRQIDLQAESGSSGFGYPYPTAIADPLQAVLSSLAFPSLDDRHVLVEGDEGDRVWTVYLDGLFWADGTAVRSNHVVESLETLISRRTKSPYAMLFRHVLGYDAFRKGETGRLEGLHLIGGQRLQILLREPDPRFRERLAHPAAGLIRWNRKTPLRPRSGPVAWIPSYGSPRPVGLADAAWAPAVAPATEPLAAQLLLPGLSVTLHPEDSHGEEDRLRLTGPPLPSYCSATAEPAGTEIARGRSLVVLLMRPREMGGDRTRRGLPLGERLALGERIASRHDLWPGTDQFVRAEGLLENPPGTLADMLRREARDTPAPDGGGAIRFLFHPSADPVLSCIARRLAALASPASNVRVLGAPHTRLQSNLRYGDFDMMLLAFPSMAPTPWESAAVTLGFLSAHLWDPSILTRMEDWMTLPVDPARAEAQARRLEGEMMTRCVLLPVGWIQTRLVSPEGDPSSVSELGADDIFTSFGDAELPVRR